jgi:hypothetical protein
MSPEKLGQMNVEVEPLYSKEVSRWKAFWVLDDDPIEIYGSGKMEGDILDEDGCTLVRQPCENGLLEVESEEKTGEGHQDQNDQWSPGQKSADFHRAIIISETESKTNIQHSTRDVMIFL